MGTGKIPYSSFKVQLYFPIQGLAVVVKKNFFSLLLLRLSWGNIIVPFMTHKEFLFPLLAASPPRRGNIPSPFFEMMGLGHSHVESENLVCSPGGGNFQALASTRQENSFP